MRKAKNIYFLFLKKKMRWPKAGGDPMQGTFPYFKRIYQYFSYHFSDISDLFQLIISQKIQKLANLVKFL